MRGVLDTEGAEGAGALKTGARDGLGALRGVSARTSGAGTRTTGAALFAVGGRVMTVGRPPASPLGTVVTRPPRGWLGVLTFGVKTPGVVERGVTVAGLALLPELPPEGVTALLAASVGRELPRTTIGRGDRGESLFPLLALSALAPRMLAGLAVLPLAVGVVVGREPGTRGVEVDPAGRAAGRSPPLVTGFSEGLETVSVRPSASNTSRREFWRGSSELGRRDTGRILLPDSLATVSTGTPRLMTDWLTVV